jgi:hypothetical protein
VPVVTDKSIDDRLTEILVRVAIGNRAGRGNAKKKVREVISRRASGEGKTAPRIPLREKVELLPPVIGAVGEAVPSTDPAAVV